MMVFLTVEYYNGFIISVCMTYGDNILILGTLFTSKCQIVEPN